MCRIFLKTNIILFFLLAMGGLARAAVLADTVLRIPDPYAEIMFVDVPESRDDSSVMYQLWQKEIEEEEIEELWQLRENFAYTSFNPNVLHYRHPDDVIRGKDTVWITLLDSASVYSHPFKGRLTSPFGFRWGRMHYGTDVGLRTGDTIVAAFDGIVRIAQRNYSYGNIVILFHKNGLETYYAHMSRLLVQPNQAIPSDWEAIRDVAAVRTCISRSVTWARPSTPSILSTLRITGCCSISSRYARRRFTARRLPGRVTIASNKARRSVPSPVNTALPLRS